MLPVVLWTLGGTLILLVAFLFVGWPDVRTDVTYGMTFSRAYAEQDLGLDADAVLAAAVDDLGIRRFRIPVTWKTVQPTPDAYDFEELDRDIAKISDAGGTVVLAIGEKVPRWPECWGPDWWKALPREEQRERTLEFLQTIVERYRRTPAIGAWQVENEPHFIYGDCPKPDMLFLRKEIDFVRSLDPTRPVMTTDSGELSAWLTFGKTVDRLGVSVYRVVRNPIIGTWRYVFIPPWFYQRKAMIVSIFGVRGIYVSEFQMEPWSNRPLTETPIEDQFDTMDIGQMRKNFGFAERMGLSPIDFWGVEWWYWMKEQGHPEFWEEAKAFYRAH
ncbi:beta-galactosidase [Candidatus Uhrbacteria bacterium]|nr:beta-galactosidase [Candidatus Uhrbacteria bacterium]